MLHSWPLWIPFGPYPYFYDGFYLILSPVLTASHFSWLSVEGVLTLDVIVHFLTLFQFRQIRAHCFRKSSIQQGSCGCTHIVSFFCQWTAGGILALCLHDEEFNTRFVPARLWWKIFCCKGLWSKRLKAQRAPISAPSVVQYQVRVHSLEFVWEPLSDRASK